MECLVDNTFYKLIDGTWHRVSGCGFTWIKATVSLNVQYQLNQLQRS